MGFCGTGAAEAEVEGVRGDVWFEVEGNAEVEALEGGMPCAFFTLSA